MLKSSINRGVESPVLSFIRYTEAILLDVQLLYSVLDHLTAGSIFAMLCLVISAATLSLYFVTRWREFLVASGCAALYVVPIALNSL
jgi:hypothetical protein